MTRWEDQPSEVARVLNPAYLGLVLWSVARGYSAGHPAGLPYALAFVATPVVLHRRTRETLPRAVRTSLAAWINENPAARVGFRERARGLAPFVREGILYAAASGLLEVVEARLVPAATPKTLKPYLREATEEVTASLKRAEFVGKWFESVNSASTVLALWGVIP